MTPSFDGATEKYSIVVEGSVDSISIAASAVASTSSVTGTGKTALKTGTNTFEIICTSQSGNAKTYTLTVVRQELEVGEVTSSVYKIGSKYITGLKPGVKASDFLGKISAEGATLKVVDASGKEKTGKLATGNKLQVYDSKNELVKSYEIVIYGDANGDGDINVLDMIKVNRHILGLSKLSGCYLTAADANRDNAGVNVLDMIFINRHALGLTTIKQD